MSLIVLFACVDIAIVIKKACCFIAFQIPEDNENFTITLSDTTGGASIGSPAVAILTIARNDGPIYFKGCVYTALQTKHNESIDCKEDGAPLITFAKGSNLQ